MKSYLFKNPNFFSWIYPDSIWRLPSKEKVIYLTFDDGPDDEVTEYVLDLLDEYNAKATFFCIGSLIEKFPTNVQRAVEERHLVANHTFNHENGWKTNTITYGDSVDQCKQSLLQFETDNLLVRPPYGKLKRSQQKTLRHKNYNIVFWSHLSGDFDPDLDIRKSLTSLKKAESGSILLFHDSQKAFKNLKQLLPKVLAHFAANKFSFKTLPVNAH